MKPKVYIETTIISYLTSWRSPQLVMAANQECTRIWWDDERHGFDLYISEAVVQEASGGDPAAAERRLEAIEGLPILPITDGGRQLAKELIGKTPLPTNAQVDALHIANSHPKRNGISSYLELPSHCERHFARGDDQNLRRRKSSITDYLYTRGID